MMILFLLFLLFLFFFIEAKRKIVTCFGAEIKFFFIIFGEREFYLEEKKKKHKNNIHVAMFLFSFSQKQKNVLIAIIYASVFLFAVLSKFCHASNLSAAKYENDESN